MSLPVAAGPSELRCRLGGAIEESSGVASASWSDDVVFTHNDSGDRARFFEVDARTCATRTTYGVGGATNTDWEDMARGTAGDGTAVLWLADIGDNRADRRSVVVYEVAEPGPDAADDRVDVRSRSTLTYPDGAHDAETLLVDPETGRPVIVTKDGAGGRSVAYRLPSGGSGVLERLAQLDVRALDGGSFASPAWQVTGGATSPDRRAVVLRTYLAAWLWTAAPGEPLAAVLARPPETLDPPLDRQAEAVSFSRDGSALWLTSEGAEAPLHRIPLGPPPAGAPAVAPSVAAPVTEPVIPPARARDRPVAVPMAVAAGGVLLAGAIVALGIRRRRRR